MPTLTIARQLPWLEPFQCELVIDRRGLRTAPAADARYSGVHVPTPGSLNLLQQMHMEWSEKLLVMRVLIAQRREPDHCTALIKQIAVQV